MLKELIPTKEDQTVKEDYLALLQSAGQKTLLQGMQARNAGCTLVSEEKILTFLTKKGYDCLGKYDNYSSWGFEKSIDGTSDGRHFYRWDAYYRVFVSGSNKGWFSGASASMEARLQLMTLENYQGLIPELQLKKIVSTKSFFDKVLIASFKFGPAPMPDPIAFGHIRNHNGLFFITQWDNDLLLDDLI